MAKKLNKPQNPKELFRRLPEIKQIEDEELQDQLVEIFIKDCPQYFWNAPASSSGNHHPPDTRGRHGLLLHTKRAFQAFEHLAETELQQGALTEEQVDYGRASILLHDLFKQGYEPRDEHRTQKNHDKLAAGYLKRTYDLPEEVIGCVDSHNGAWNEGKEPETLLEKVHHQADYIAAREDAKFDVLEPCEELQDIILEEKTREEQQILDRVNKLSETLQHSGLIWKLRIPGIGRVDASSASKVVRYIINGGDE